MSRVVTGRELVSVVEELSLDSGYSRDALNRVLFKWFSEELVEVSRVEELSGRVAVSLDSYVLSVAELRAFWSDFRKELAELLTDSRSELVGVDSNGVNGVVVLDSSNVSVVD